MRIWRLGEISAEELVCGECRSPAVVVTEMGIDGEQLLWVDTRCAMCGALGSVPVFSERDVQRYEQRGLWSRAEARTIRRAT